MKLETILLVVTWTLIESAVGQYQHMMQLQHQNAQRQNSLGMMRIRSPLIANRPRWASATTQSQTLARPYKPLYTYMKGPPHLYRTQKPLTKYPTAYANYWKAPINFRPSGVKDVFRSPPSQAALIGASSHQLLAGPASAQKILAVKSPVQNLIIGPSPGHNLLSGVPKKQHYQTITPQSNKFLSGHALSYTTQPLISPVTPTPSVAYPIRVDGDGGPIHTIPAPNLSLADKPIVVPDYNNYLEAHANKIKSSHTYEVTEEPSDKTYYDHVAAGQNKFYAADTHNSVSTTKLFPTGNYFSSSTHSFLPQASALRAQPVAPSLTSQELFALLSDATPQQQLADTYTLPLLQQPQLQQHFLQQTSFDTLKAMQPFSAVIQQSQLPASNSQENILFKPDPKYVEKIQEQFLRQSTNHPHYQTFNYQEPVKSHAMSYSDADQIKSNIQQALGDDLDLSSVHYNVIRNTKEAVPQTYNFNMEQINNQTNIDDAEASASFNVETKNNFRPIEFTNEEINDTLASLYLSEIDNIATSSLPPEYLAKLQNKNIIDTFASLQTAGNLIKSGKNYDPPQQEYFNYNSYFMQNPSEQNTPIFDKNYNNDFTPNNGFPLIMNDDKEMKEQSAIRIYVPEQYDDINTQPTENIKVGASLNTEDGPKNDMTIVFENDDTDDSNYQSEYDEQSSEERDNDKVTSVEPNTAAKEQTTEAYEYQKTNPDDVVVMVPRNISHPTLDILTKDWKTSIVIKSKPNGKTNTQSELNQISEFGSRIKPKREER